MDEQNIKKECKIDFYEKFILLFLVLSFPIAWGIFHFLDTYILYIGAVYMFLCILFAVYCYKKELRRVSFIEDLIKKI